MLILIEDTERGLDVAQGIWGAFSSCLYIEDAAMVEPSVDYIISQCAKSGVVLIIVTEAVMQIKSSNKHAFCISCDGGNMEDENDRTLIFLKEDKRDNIVTLIINYLKRKKLL